MTSEEGVVGVYLEHIVKNACKDRTCKYHEAFNKICKKGECAHIVLPDERAIFLGVDMKPGVWQITTFSPNTSQSCYKINTPVPFIYRNVPYNQRKIKSMYRHNKSNTYFPNVNHNYKDCVNPNCDDCILFACMRLCIRTTDQTYVALGPGPYHIMIPERYPKINDNVLKYEDIAAIIEKTLALKQKILEKLNHSIIGESTTQVK